MKEITTTEYECDRCGHTIYGNKYACGDGYAVINALVDFGSTGSNSNYWLCGFCTDAFHSFFMKNKNAYTTSKP